MPRMRMDIVQWGGCYACIWLGLNFLSMKRINRRDFVRKIVINRNVSTLCTKGISLAISEEKRISG